jgi:MATE family multidrug resistance protein
MDGARNPAVDVVTRPSVAQLLGLAWPIVISRSAQTVVGITDAVMCARLGEEALAATNSAGINAFGVLVLFMGTSFIVSSFASQLVGARDYAGARRFGWYGLVLAAGAGLVGILAVPLVGPLLSHLQFTPHVRDLIVGYLQMRLLSCGFAAGMEAMSNYYGGLGNTRLPMAAQIIAMVLNVLFCWMFIFGNLGAPAMGVPGSGLAATLASAAAFAFIAGCFFFGVGHEKSALAEPARLNAREFFRMLRFGLPVGLNWFVEFGAFWLFVNVIMAGLGTTPLAAVSAVFQLTSISFMPSFAIASAGSIFVGQAIGANKRDDVPRTVKLTLATAATWQGMAGLACLVAPGVLLSLFVNDESAQQAFVEAGVRFLMLSAAWQLFDAVSMVFAEALRAAGDTAFSFWARAVIAWVVFAPGAWVTARIAKADAIYVVAWLVVYLVLLGVVLVFRFRTNKWRTMQLTEPKL